MKKIMFNDRYGLTKAVLEGKKTQTRRIAYDFRKHTSNNVTKCVILPSGSITYMDGEIQVLDDMPQPSYKIGEEVAVAQKYSELEYGVDWIRRSINKEHAGWNNKLFVSAEEMPHSIKITNIRIERLQDISEEDCLKEGVKRKNERYIIENEKGVVFYTNSPLLAFRYLIDKTCGKGTWESNPWVFVYDFELIK